MRLIARYPVTSCWIAFIAGAVLFWVGHP